MPNKHFTRFFLLLSLLTISNLFLSPQAYAQTASDSAVSDDQTTQNLRQRIEKIVEEKREQIKGVLSELTKSQRGFIGEVQRVSEGTLAVRTNKGPRIVPIQNSVAITRKGKPIKVEEIAVGEWVVMVGSLEDDTFQAQKIFVSETSLRPSTQVVALGTIAEINRSEMVIQPRQEQAALEVLLTKNTSYQDLEGNSIKLADLDNDLQVLMVGAKNDKDEVVASTIRLLTNLSPENDANQ